MPLLKTITDTKYIPNNLRNIYYILYITFMYDIPVAYLRRPNVVHNNKTCV